MSTKPNSKEIEISVFGKSSHYGECILVHLQNDQWLIIDSFQIVEKDNNIPIAQFYLQKLYGNEWVNKIKYVVITHWHDDHIRGVSKILNQSKNIAKFIISGAIKYEELQYFTTKHFEERERIKNSYNTILNQVASILNSQIEEFGENSFVEYPIIEKLLNKIDLPYEIKAKLFSSFREYSVTYRDVASIIYENLSKIKNAPVKELTYVGKWLETNKKAFLPVNESSVQTVERNNVKFISPVSRVLLETIQKNKLKEIFEWTGRKEANSDLNANLLSVGIKLEFDNESVLLGADIEGSWKEIIKNLENSLKSNIFKVAHHGSENGFDENIWKELLKENPISVLTSYKKGETILPKIEYANKINSLSAKAYITTNPYKELAEDSKKSAYDEKIYAKAKIYDLSKYGQVRLRYENDWQINTFGTAIELKEIQEKQIK